VRRLLVCLALLAVSTPAALGGSAPHPRQLGPFGSGANLYWLWHAQGKRQAVVVFLHGLDRSELNPANHLPWIEHLAQRGDDVIYPNPFEGPVPRRPLLRDADGPGGAASVLDAVRRPRQIGRRPR
jgi:hypothetical protein